MGYKNNRGGGGSGKRELKYANTQKVKSLKLGQTNLLT